MIAPTWDRKRNLKPMKLGCFFISQVEGRWNVWWENPKTEQNIKINPDHPVAQRHIFDMAVMAYDRLVIDYGVHPQQLDSMIGKLVHRSVGVTNQTARWLSSCWLFARAQQMALENPEAAQASRARFTLLEAFGLIYGEQWLKPRDMLQLFGRSGHEYPVCAMRESSRKSSFLRAPQNC